MVTDEWGEVDRIRYHDRGLDWTIWAFYEAAEPMVMAKAADPEAPNGWFQYRATFKPASDPAEIFRMTVDDLKTIEWGKNPSRRINEVQDDG